MRVREIIRVPEIKAKLIRLIPKYEKDAKLQLKDVKSKYPDALVKLFPNTYSDLGLITEYVLRYSVDDINELTLSHVTEQVNHIQIPDKVLSLGSTRTYLEKIRQTRMLLDEQIDEDEEFIYDEELSFENVSGHPDIITYKRLFEVKTTCKAFTDWYDYLLQIFSYAAIALTNNMDLETINLVLPLQGDVWIYDVKNWTKHNEFMTILNSYEPPAEEDIEFGLQLMHEAGIGITVTKEKGRIINTLKEMSKYGTPFQFFLNGNVQTQIYLSDDEMDECMAFMIQNPRTKAFVHLPYSITLSNQIDEKDGYTLRALMQYMTCVSRMQFLGGVVHVGKANIYSKEEAIENMRNHIIESLEYATERSPILLETPSGQGYELLTTFDEFMDFMDSIPDPRFGICLDTCHVFATGQLPGEYMAKMMSNERWITRLKLIHFNDSKGDCGSCVDRHARIGCGHVPKDDFLQVASIASIYSIPMVIE